MLTILVGNVKSHIKVDLCAEDLHLLPRQTVAIFDLWVDMQKNQILRVYNDTIVNHIGAQIEKGILLKDNVQVITTHGTHTYTDKGVLDSTWPYGIFNI